MKLKRFISAFLAAGMLIGAVPLNAFASNGNVVISDVQNCKSWDLTRSRYITYKVNGVKFDSRETDPSFNLQAYRSMNENQKEQVARWMVCAGYRGRRVQFTEQGASELMDEYDFVSGWKDAAGVLEQRIGNKYCKELTEFYSDQDDKYRQALPR